MNVDLAWLLRDDEDSVARGPRLHAPSDAQGEEPTVAIVNQQFAQHFFQNESAGRQDTCGFGVGPQAKLDDRDHRRRRRLARTEGPREGVRRQVFVPNWGQIERDVLRAHDSRFGGRIYSLVRDEVRRLDAVDAGLLDEDRPRRSSTKRLLTDRADRDAVGGLRSARDAARVDRPLRRDGALVVARRKKELGIRLALGAAAVRGRAGSS